MNTGLPHIEINSDGSRSQIMIDGSIIKGVRGFTFTHNVGEIPILQLELIATDANFNGEALPQVLLPFYNPDGDENGKD